MSKPLKPQGEEPRSEPEVIPPDHAERGTESVRVYIATPGPLGTILVVLIVGLLSAVLLVLLLGALLVWLPVVVLFVTGAIIVGLLRVHFRIGKLDVLYVHCRASSASMSQGPGRMKKTLTLGFLLLGLQQLSAQPLPLYDLGYYDSPKCIKEKANSFAKNTLISNKPDEAVTESAATTARKSPHTI